MGQEVTIGGERLGSGKRMKAYMHGYERSTHDLSYLWRSSMASGTLVPFMTEVALPGDTFDINLDADCMTLPTIGPLFGSYDIQLDVFQVPMRLYQGKLHMNMLGIGMDMSSVQLPQLALSAKQVNITKPIDNQQINGSCIFSYLGIRGLGSINNAVVGDDLERYFNAIPYLGYWDIYKNYYANKQEEIGAVIHKNVSPGAFTISDADIMTGASTIVIDVPRVTGTFKTVPLAADRWLRIITTGLTVDDSINLIRIQVKKIGSVVIEWKFITELFEDITVNLTTQTITCTGAINNWMDEYEFNFIQALTAPVPDLSPEPEVYTFPLDNIDTMRRQILAHLTAFPFYITNTSLTPYKWPMDVNGFGNRAMEFSQEGLALKTYKSDLFNNWIDTEWIDGVDGISAITAVSTVGDSFTIDELNLSKKIYNMLNRIAISGGSYDDWLDAVYDHDRQRSAENPMYMGGLIKKLVFQEVISNAASQDQPLGTLAGRGKMTDYRKGGNIVIKVDEPSYIMGIVSITPNIDYSQGNKWDVNLKTMNDLHKPALDEIGFQDLITDQMAWFDTTVNDQGTPTYKSAGKQPAWVNYMTNVNKVYGNFADQQQEMFMVLNRRYSPRAIANGALEIGDLTTYIDPTKFNHIFANTRRDAQNFWMQISVDIEARRKMSAKIIPNL